MQTILITGATSGVGASLARLLLDEGHRVVATARNPEKADLLDRRLGTSYPATFHALDVDLADTTTIPPFLDQLAGQGNLDVVVLNAGVHVPYRKVSTPGRVELHEQVNFRSNAAIATSLALDNARTRIVYVGSNAYRIARARLRVGTSFWWRYALSKYRAMVFFSALARCRRDAAVLSISPGSVLTDVHRHKNRLIRSLNEARGIYISPEKAAAEMAPVVLAQSPSSFYYDRGEPTDVSFYTDVDRMFAALWGPVDRLLRDMLGIEAEMELDHAGLVGRLGMPEERPVDVRSVMSTLADAAERGGSVKARGSRHSYNDCFVGSETSMTVEALDSAAVVDAEQGRATVGAGRTVFELVDDLHRQGWTLRYAGNYGAQTIAGATSTGTHGYWRSGGVVSEQIEALDIVDGEGRLRHIDSGDFLAAARVGLGLLGVITSVTLRVVPTGRPMIYQVTTTERETFWSTHDDLARGHEYMRFFEPHPDVDSIAVLTIDPAPEGSEPIDPEFIDRGASIPTPLLRAMRSATHGRPGEVVIPRLPIETTAIVPFSADLFVKAGLTRAGMRRLSRVAYTVANDDRTWNMEVAIPPLRARDFLTQLGELRRVAGERGEFQSYWTARYCGANDATLLAPNRGRDVYFVDVHVSRESHDARGFLLEVQRLALEECDARLHWGKVLFGGPDELLANYDEDVVARFHAVRDDLDPKGIFVDRFARRHLGL